MMVRTQIVLESEMRNRTRRRAAELNISLAEYIRRLVARDLGAPAGSAQPSQVFDLGRSDGSDVSRQKRGMLAEAFARPRR